MNLATLFFGVAIGALFMTLFDLYTRRRWRARFELYLHVKSGSTYMVLETGRLEANGARCVIYRNVDRLKDPEIWVRDYNEFFDGRFKSIGTTYKA